MALPCGFGLPVAPAFALTEAAVRRFAFRPVVGRPPSGSPNGARADPCPDFSSPSAYGFLFDFTVTRIGTPGRSKLSRIELIR